ncbi:MAG TPA: hypothetical protein VF832_12840 [Longimicrobiales bacterium]
MTRVPAGPERMGVEPHDPPPGADALSRRLIEHEANGRPAAAEGASPAERVLQRLRQELSHVLGGEGFSALEARALDLARRRHSFLAKGATSLVSLEDARAALAGREPDEVRAALHTVCTDLIGLLFTFLGEPLTTQLIRLAWPDLPGDDPAAGERETR